MAPLPKTVFSTAAIANQLASFATSVGKRGGLPQERYRKLHSAARMTTSSIKALHYHEECLIDAILRIPETAHKRYWVLKLLAEDLPSIPGAGIAMDWPLRVLMSLFQRSTTLRDEGLLAYFGARKAPAQSIRASCHIHRQFLGFLDLATNIHPLLLARAIEGNHIHHARHLLGRYPVSDWEAVTTNPLSTRTALHVARSPAMTLLLLEHGALACFTKPAGTASEALLSFTRLTTPPPHAFEITSFLLARGADPCHLSAQGSALSHAICQRNEGVLSALRPWLHQAFADNSVIGPSGATTMQVLMEGLRGWSASTDAQAPAPGIVEECLPLPPATLWHPPPHADWDMTPAEIIEEECRVGNLLASLWKPLVQRIGLDASLPLATAPKARPRM